MVAEAYRFSSKCRFYKFLQNQFDRSGNPWVILPMLAVIPWTEAFVEEDY